MSQEKSSVERAAFVSDRQGENADLYTLQNASGAIAKITNYGAALTELHVPDKRGELRNVVLGFPTLEQYVVARGHFGATIGRFANRICGGKFTLEGREYQLYKNDRDSNTLHGGRIGFDKRMWKTEQTDTTNGASVALAYSSENMEEGFPGQVEVHVVYTLTDQNALEIQFTAQTTKATPINLTNHSYFNLNGESGTMLDHELWIDSDYTTETNDKLCPTGLLKRVAGTACDFRTEELIGEKMARLPSGYDHNFCLNSPSMDRPSLTLHAPRTGITLDMFTNQPGVQVYSSTHMKPEETCGAFDKYYGLTLETQNYPDAINQPKFPDSVLRSGETYVHNVRYLFGFRG
jgi:aldose 1-epimerase